MDKRCSKCSIKKDYERLGFTMPGQLAACMSCQDRGGYLYSKDEPKGVKGNVTVNLEY